MNTKKWKVPTRVILLIVGLIILSGVFIGYELYNKPQRSVEDEVAIAITAKELFQKFESDEAKANATFLNKAVLVTGKISEISRNQDGKTVLVLETDNPMFGVTCTLEDSMEVVAPQTNVSVKGICTGYLSDVVVTRGILENKEK